MQHREILLLLLFIRYRCDTVCGMKMCVCVCVRLHAGVGGCVCAPHRVGSNNQGCRKRLMLLLLARQEVSKLCQLIPNVLPLLQMYENITQMMQFYWRMLLTRASLCFLYWWVTLWASICLMLFFTVWGSLMDLLNERQQKTAVTMRRSALVLYDSTSSYSGPESNPKRTDDPTLCSWTQDFGSRMWQIFKSKTWSILDLGWIELSWIWCFAVRTDCNAESD